MDAIGTRMLADEWSEISKRLTHWEGSENGCRVYVGRGELLEEGPSWTAVMVSLITKHYFGTLRSEIEHAEARAKRADAQKAKGARLQDN